MGSHLARDHSRCASSGSWQDFGLHPEQHQGSNRIERPTDVKEPSRWAVTARGCGGAWHSGGLHVEVRSGRVRQCKVGKVECGAGGKGWTGRRFSYWKMAPKNFFISAQDS